MIDSVLQRPASSLHNGEEKTEHIEPAGKERMVLASQIDGRRRLLCQKEKEQSHQFESRLEVLFKVGKNLVFMIRRSVRKRDCEVQSEHHAEGKRIPRRKGRQAESLPGGRRRKHKRVSGCKVSPRRPKKF